MLRRSAGILPYRRGANAALEVLVAHPGGPIWARRDLGAWSIVKGECEPGEDELATARREFAEELAIAAPEGRVLPLGEIRQRGGKVVVAFAIEAARLEPRPLEGSTFEIEWPPRSGERRSFPEVDRVAWFDLEEAALRLNPAQVPFLERIGASVRGG